jgi:hypothetical protein
MGVCVTVWVTREPDTTVVRIVVAGDGFAELEVYAELEAGALLEVGSEEGVWKSEVSAREHDH